MIKSPIIIKFVLLICLISYSSCSEDSTSNNNNNVNPNVVNSIGGVITGLPANSRQIKSEVVKDTLRFTAGSATVGADSTFNINLAAPPDEYLSTISELFSLLPQNYPDAEAKGSFLNNFTYNQTSSELTGIIIKSNRPASITPSEGDFSVSYLYTNMSTNFNGSTSNIVNSDTLKYNISLSLGTGYNKVTYKIIAKRTGYTEINISSGEQSGANWYYNGLFQ